MKLEDFPEDIKLELENWIDTEVINWEESANDENEAEELKTSLLLELVFLFVCIVSPSRFYFINSICRN